MARIPIGLNVMQTAGGVASGVSFWSSPDRDFAYIQTSRGESIESDARAFQARERGANPRPRFAYGAGLKCNCLPPPDAQ